MLEVFKLLFNMITTKHLVDDLEVEEPSNKIRSDTTKPININNPALAVACCLLGYYDDDDFDLLEVHGPNRDNNSIDDQIVKEEEEAEINFRLQYPHLYGSEEFMSRHPID